MDLLPTVPLSELKCIRIVCTWHVDSVLGLVETGASFALLAPPAPLVAHFIHVLFNHSTPIADTYRRHCFSAGITFLKIQFTVPHRLSLFDTIHVHNGVHEFQALTSLVQYPGTILA